MRPLCGRGSLVPALRLRRNRLGQRGRFSYGSFLAVLRSTPEFAPFSGVLWVRPARGVQGGCNLPYAEIEAHLSAILDAIDAGVPVTGYFYWSLIDNFEWAWGYDKRFGIVRVDYDTQERALKDSGREYARIIAARAL